MKKLMKKSAVLLSFAMLLPVIPATYASDALQLSDPVYSVTAGDTQTTVPAPVPGYITTTVEVTNPGGADAPACLVVSATDNATGKLVAVDIDAQTIPKGKSKKLSKGINLSAGQTHNYYVWDNIVDHTPLRNTPPTDIKNVTSDVRTNSVFLSWDDSHDDKGIKSYILKLNGEEVAKASEASYELGGLDRGSSYTCEIAACDEEGLLSGSATVDASTYDMSYLVLSDYNNGDFSFYKNHSANQIDSYTVPDHIGGRDCFANPSQEKADGSGKKVMFFYFPVTPQFIGADVADVAFEVTYFDDGSGTPSVQYNSADGNSGKTCNLDGITNTKTWKTVHATVSDAMFRNPAALTYSSFRISAPSGTRVYKVALCRGDQYSPNAPNVKFDENITDIYDMSFYPDDAISAYEMEYTSVDGIGCMKAPNGGTFEFDIKDMYAKRTGGYIEATYYDYGEDSLVLKYTDNNGPTQETVDFTDTKQFRTVRIPLNAAIFSNDIIGASGRKFDFTLSTENGLPLALTSVRYVAGDSDYVPEKVTSVYAEVNASGTDLDGTLALSSAKNYSSTAIGYDMNALFSGVAGREPVDGKHYLYNEEYTGYSPGQAWKRWKNAIYFRIPDDFLYGNDYKNVKFEIEYYLPTTGNMEIVGKNASGSDTTIAKDSITPGVWTTKVFEVTPSDGKNIVFSNSLSGCDFRINFDCQGYVHKVTVYKDIEE